MEKSVGNYRITIQLSILALMGVLNLFGPAECSVAHGEDCSEMAAEVNLTRTFTLETPEGVESTQPQVTFPHLNHAMEYGCAACHHQWEPDTEASPAECFECHSNTKERTGEDSYFAAFHNRQAETSCLGCHMITTQDEDSSGGPLKCNECHIRD